MRKKLLIVLMIMSCTTSFIGCWDKKELNQLSFVTAIGLDKDEITGEYISTTQVIRIEAIQKEGGSANIVPIELFSARGKTLAEARKNLTAKFDRRPFYGHCKVVIISQKLAEEGLKPVFDRILRTYEIRPVTTIVIAKDNSPEKYLSVRHGISKIQGAYLRNIIEWRNESSEANVSTVKDFVQGYFSNESAPITGYVETMKDITPVPQDSGTSEKLEIRLAGTAIFKEDKLKGYLNRTESRGLNWVTGKIQRATVTVASPKLDNKFYSIFVRRAKSEVKPEIINGRYVFNINVQATTELMEQQDEEDTSKPKILETVADEAEKAIEKEIIQAMNKLQKDYEIDAVGFASALNRWNSSEWKKVKKNWDKEFPKVGYKVSVNVKITRAGSLQKPIKLEK